jgi:hypothetical protein
MGVVDIWTARSQSPTLSALLALVSRPTTTITSQAPVSTPHGVVACKTNGRCGVWEKSVEMHGARHAKTELPVGGDVDY